MAMYICGTETANEVDRYPHLAAPVLVGAHSVQLQFCQPPKAPDTSVG